MGCGEDVDVRGAEGGLLRVFRFDCGRGEAVASVGCGCCGRGDKRCVGGGIGSGYGLRGAGYGSCGVNQDL